MAVKIPAVLHQIGRDQSIPQHLEGFCRSWKQWNPDLEIMYWSDQTLREFIAQQAPRYLSWFDGYVQGVCRADLGRYLLLQHYGGIYADLDCQCLRALAPLLDGRELLIAPEPAIHQQQRNVLERGLSRIICPSFMASIPVHPFWEDVLAVLKNYPPSSVQTSDDVLDATGPFLLSRVMEERPTYKRYLVPETWIYPFSKAESWQGLVFDPIFWSERTSGAFVAHYWDGSWFQLSRGLHAFVPSQAPVHVQEPHWRAAIPGVVKRNTGDPSELPLISCLMVVTSKWPVAIFALNCFLAQSYPHKELILVDASAEGRMAMAVEAASSAEIRYVSIDDESLTLSRLHNMALDHALGDYICHWNSDDLHDPLRLEMQWKVLQSTEAQASLLARWMIWWPGQKVFAMSSYRDVGQSVLCERSLFPRYAQDMSGEKCDDLDRLSDAVRIAKLDLPRLCIHRDTGKFCSTSDAREGEAERKYPCLWTQQEYEHLAYELARRVPLFPGHGQDKSGSLPCRAPESCEPLGGGEVDPNVLILTPVRDAQRHLDRYASLLERLNFDSGRLSLAWLEGDSSDQTFTGLEELRVRLAGHFHRISLHRSHHYPPRTQAERWQQSLQRDRRERLARVRNQLLMEALQDEDWVLWLDVDVCDYPADLLDQLLAARRDIVTANCLNLSGEPFDLNSYRLKRESEQGEAFQQEFMLGGLYQPPVGFGRHYVNHFRAQSLVELDAVGATVLLVRADLHRQGLNFPSYPTNGLIETEAFSLVARAQGVRSWALPQLIVRHG